MLNIMRSLDIAMFFSLLRNGNFLSYIVTSIVDKIRRRNKEGSCFQDNLNEAHIDYFIGF